jgi:hypothetical protein
VCRFLRKACAWKSHIILGFEKKGEKPHLGYKKGTKLTALGYKSSILNVKNSFHHNNVSSSNHRHQNKKK